jgi:hypothetical protein
MNKVIALAKKRVTKGIARKAALAGVAASSVPVSAAVFAAYYAGSLSFNAVLALVYTRRYAEGICSVFDGGRVTASDVIGLTDDLIPIVNLESFGVDKEVLAAQLAAMLKATPSLQEILDALKGLRN